jgi:hypothetical protein
MVRYREFHRRIRRGGEPTSGPGAGRALVRALEDAIQADGTRFLSVKTLGPSRPDENYRRTRVFYEACGFAPVEEFLDLWPDNPCLFMVKSLGA